MAHNTVAGENRVVDWERHERDTAVYGSGAKAKLDEHIVSLIHRDDLYDHLEQYPREAHLLTERARLVAERAFQGSNAAALHEAHKTLYALYEDHVRPSGAGGENQFNPQLLAVRNILERGWERHELGRIAVDIDEVPESPDAFADYFRDVCRRGDMGQHPLFEFLETRATRADLVAFFLSDAAVIVRFCDLVVLTMVGAVDEIRGELADNFWDEMGSGRMQERHVHLYRNLLEYAGVNLPPGDLTADHFVDNLDWTGLAGYNLYLFLCLHRRNQLRSLGALGAAEMMDPPQYSRVLAGCRRVGLDEEARLAYYAGHESMDVEHGDRWLNNVLLPLVRKYPERRHEIVVGALMRINVTRDYFDSLTARLAPAGA